MMAFLITIANLAALLSSCAALDNKESSFNDVQTLRVNDMVEWLKRMRNGYINPKLDVGRAEAFDPSSYFGIFANEKLKKGEFLMRIPKEAKMKLQNPSSLYIDDLCDLAWMLREEFEKGDNSAFAPYLQYLNEQEKGILPSLWSDAGKELLLKVQGDLNMMDYNYESVPGDHLTNWMDEWFGGDSCFDRDGETLDPHMLALVVQRGFDTTLAPVYDMINHHDGMVNTVTRHPVWNEDDLEVYAYADISEGDELYFSYFRSPDSNDYQGWGTMEILRDFGFIEPYPHLFHLTRNISMAIYRTRGEENETKTFSVKCWDYCPNDMIARQQIKRLKDVYHNDILPAEGLVPKHEYDVIIQYSSALMTAFGVYISAYDSVGDDFFEDEVDSSHNEDDFDPSDSPEAIEDRDDSKERSCIHEDLNYRTRIGNKGAKMQSQLKTQKRGMMMKKGIAAMKSMIIALVSKVKGRKRK